MPVFQATPVCVSQLLTGVRQGRGGDVRHEIGGYVRRGMSTVQVLSKTTSQLASSSASESGDAATN